MRKSLLGQLVTGDTHEETFLPIHRPDHFRMCKLSNVPGVVSTIATLRPLMSAIYQLFFLFPLLLFSAIEVWLVLQVLMSDLDKADPAV